MPVSVYLRTPFTDLTGPTVNCQFMTICSKMEMKAINCVEAYGEDRAQTKCKALLEDLYECVTKTKQMARVLEMKMEREKQISQGVRGYAEGPAHDSFQAPTTL
uniref:NADH dehydrogenase [ubiquinone] iron-sulfur protein 5 n=1 Tax=Lygus hesperus TaxID=30085 RepID=A0A0A9XIK0_LYGHE